MGKQTYGSGFKIYPEDHQVIYLLLAYFIRDEEECAKHSIDLRKGVLLNGPIGCGKTSLISLFRNFAYQNLKYPVISTRDIASAFNIEGYAIIQKYGQKYTNLCLDDLGVEQVQKHFGNECNTIGEILLNRYDCMLHTSIFTHATTNLNAQELEKMYGNRVRSRMRSMFNLITFPANSPDKRK